MTEVSDRRRDGIAAEKKNIAFGEDDMTSISGHVNWEHLEKKYRIVITGNKASVCKQGLLRDKPVLTATGFLGTKAIDIEMNGHTLELKTECVLTEANLASELKMYCLFALADWEMAQARVAAEGIRE